jgi:hypothetical protein
MSLSIIYSRRSADSISAANTPYNRNRVVQVRADSTAEDNTNSKGYKGFRMPKQRRRANVYPPDIGKRLKGDNSKSNLTLTANTLITF